MTGEPLMAQDLLETLVGDWEGVYNLWLEPGTLRGESAVRATIRSVLKGRYVVHDYEWADQGAPQQGTMLLGQDGESVWQMAWVDSPEATGLGSYDSGDEHWGWRTTWVMPDLDHLVVTAWNVSPGGREDKATETTYERRA